MNKILGGLSAFFFLLAASVVVFNLGVNTTKASEWVGSWESLDAEVFRGLESADKCGPEVQEKILVTVNAFIWHTNRMFGDSDATPADFRKVLRWMPLAQTLASFEQECLQWDGHMEKLSALAQKIKEHM